jgi:hypothetical protein
MMNAIEEYAQNEPLSPKRIRTLNGQKLYVVCHEDHSVNGYYLVLKDHNSLYKVEKGYFCIDDVDSGSLEVYRRKPEILLPEPN